MTGRSRLLESALFSQNCRIILDMFSFEKLSKQVLLLLCVWSAAALHAQTVSGWDAVKRIPSDRLIRVRSSHRFTVCNFDSADDGSLTCTERHTVFFVPTKSSRHFLRSEVQSVRLSRQGVSTVLGMVIGAGAGAGIGAGIDASSSTREDGHLATAVMTLLGGVIGTGIGRHTDFLAGPTIYTAL
ncbi:hypothetical protein [Edaphobacter aggregans]|uniref:hypothetical protein n=1 Tax=Edaphobacter aggregans TaxID=570835 RepID=UPI0005571398|nr:hypothetical protein [Edaphobacter aggregans]